MEPAEAGGPEQEAGSREQAAGSREPEDEAPAAIAVEAPAGPSPEEEAAFLAQERESPAVNTPTLAKEPEAAGDLPPMDDLIKRIPAPARAAIDELFRARFVTVKRVPKSALKP